MMTEQLFFKRIYSFLIVLFFLVFSTFEYFFRSNVGLYFEVFVFFSLLFIKYGKSFIYKCFILILSIFVVFVLQLVLYGANPLTRIVPVICIAVAAHAVKRDLLLYIRNIIAFIALYSVIIWLLVTFSHTIENVLLDIATKYPSLNVGTAKNEDGGLNIVIYNFYSQWFSQLIGFRRNCGPFWEPGMFAVYLNMAFFINAAFLDNNKIINIIFGVALFTTFSTGGYVTFLFILLLFLFLNRNSNSWTKILVVIAFLVAAVYMMNLEYVGGKVEDQMVNATVGSDTSRFGAILTHLKIIYEHPLFGVVSVKDYSETGILSSGLLLPFVMYGVPVGMIYYYYLYISCISFGRYYNRGKKTGRFFFYMLVFVSISQTVTLSVVYMTLLFSGLMLDFKNRIIWTQKNSLTYQSA